MCNTTRQIRSLLQTLRFPVDVSPLTVVERRRFSAWSSPVTSSTTVKLAPSGPPSHPSTSPGAHRRLPLARLGLRPRPTFAGPRLGMVSRTHRRPRLRPQHSVDRRPTQPRRPRYRCDPVALLGHPPDRRLLLLRHLQSTPLRRAAPPLARLPG